MNIISSRHVSASNQQHPSGSSIPLRLRRLLILICLSVTPLVAQDNWYDYYATAQEAILVADWDEAASQLKNAIGQKRKPQLDIETYSLKFIDYLPYYWMGVCYFNSGTFDQAARAFQDSENWGAIKRSPQYERIKAYQTIIDSIQETHQQRDSLATLAATESKNEIGEALAEELVAYSGAILAEDYTTARIVLNRILQNPEYPNFSKNLHNLAALLAQKDMSPTPDTRAVAVQDSLFSIGLEAFVSGNYETARRKFREVETVAPNYPFISDWLRRTQVEMSRIGMDQDTLTIRVVERDTVQLSVAPVVAFAMTDQETRSDSILVSGTVRDDQGIDYIEMVLNGKPYLNANSQVVKIYPPDSSSEKFDFAIQLPLQAGENQISVIAHDIDPDAHRAAYPLTIMRLPPFYETPAFLGTLAAVLVLGVGGWFSLIMVKRRIAFVNKYNPYIAGAPVRNPRMFYGRDALVRRIVNSLHNNSLMIHGPRRIGKTSLLHQLKRVLESETDRQYFYVPVFIDLQGTPENRLFAVLMEDIRETSEQYLDSPLELRYSGRNTEYTARDFAADIKKILAGIAAISNKQFRMVLLIDEVDELNSYSDRTNQKLRSIFMKTFAENLIAVMSGSFIRKQWESEGSPWYNFFEEIPVGSIDRDQAEALIRYPVDGIFYYEDEAVSRILEYSEHIPYQIQKLCVNAVAHVINERRRKITPGDIDTIRDRVFEGEEN